MMWVEPSQLESTVHHGGHDLDYSAVGVHCNGLIGKFLGGNDRHAQAAAVQDLVT